MLVLVGYRGVGACLKAVRQFGVSCPVQLLRNVKKMWVNPSSHQSGGGVTSCAMPPVQSLGKNHSVSERFTMESTVLQIGKGDAMGFPQIQRHEVNQTVS